MWVLILFTVTTQGPAISISTGTVLNPEMKAKHWTLSISRDLHSLSAAIVVSMERQAGFRSLKVVEVYIMSQRHLS